ncbi:hypothetical protein D3C76_674480 [compost metagenome]
MSPEESGKFSKGLKVVSASDSERIGYRASLDLQVIGAVWRAELNQGVAVSAKRVAQRDVIDVLEPSGQRGSAWQEQAAKSPRNDVPVYVQREEIL